MLEQNCLKCGYQYDYFARTATIICAHNHVVCKTCADNLRERNGICPTCYKPVIGTGLYTAEQNQANLGPYTQPATGGTNWQPTAPTNYVYPAVNTNTYNQGYQPVNQGYQPNPAYQPNPVYQPVNQGYAPNQGYQPYVPGPVPVVRQKKNAGIFCFLAFLTIGAIIFMAVRLSQMNTCSYWGYYSCYFSSYSGYLCCYNYQYYSNCPSDSDKWRYCYTISQLYYGGERNGLIVGIVICSILTLIFLGRYVSVRKANQRQNNLAVAGPNNYARL